MKNFKNTLLCLILCMIFTMLSIEAAVPHTFSVPKLTWVKTEYETLERRMDNAVVLKVGETEAYVNNRPVTMSHAPVSIGGEAFISVDFIADAIGSVTEKNDLKQTVKIMYRTYTVDIKNNSSEMRVRNTDTVSVDLKTPVREVDGELMLPLKKFIEAVGLVYFEAENSIIFISDPEDAFDDIGSEEQIKELDGLFDKEKKEPIVIYAAPGEGGGNGTFEKPYRGIENVKEKVRQRLATGEERDIIVYLRGGRYELSKTLTFATDDSGNGYSTVTYKNYNNEEVRITGSKRITAWKPYADGIYIGRVGRKWPADCIFENDERAYSARMPNDGWYYWKPELEGENNAFYLNNDSFTEFTTEHKSLQVSYWRDGWFTAINDIKNIDFDSGRAEVEGNLAGARAENKYFLQGALDFLDMPGEFYCDKGGYVYYKPLSGDYKGSVIEAASISGEIISFAGDSADNPVKNITFDGVIVENTDSKSYGIKLAKARNISIYNSIVRNTGNNAILLDRDVKNTEIENCHIYNAGKHGVYISGNYQGFVRTTCRGNKVINCEIHDVGQILGEASCVHIFSAGYNEVRNNLCYNSPRYAIGVAGFDIYDWSYRKTVEGVEPTYENRAIFGHTKYNIIANNDLSNANTASDDTAALNLWNVDPGNIVYQNYIHDTTAPYGFHFGIYLDNRVENTLVRKNIVRNIFTSEPTWWSTGGSVWSCIMVKGFNNRVENNFFVDNPDMIQGVYQVFKDPQEKANKTSVNNVFMNSGDNLYYYKGYSDDAVVESDANIYYNPNGEYNISGDAPMKTYDDWKSTFGGMMEASSKIEDPQFMDEGDYRFKYTSSAPGVGTEDLDLEKIGLNNVYPFADKNDEPAVVYAKDAAAENQRSYMDMEENESRLLNTTVRSKRGYIINDANISYLSNNNEVATVDKDGRVIAHNNGIAQITITAKKNRKNVQTTVDVLVGDSIKEIEFSGIGDAINLNNPYDIKVTGITEYGRKFLIDDAVISGEGITVNDSTIEAFEAGSKTINICYSENGIEHVCRKDVYVIDGILDSVAITSSKDWIEVGETVSVEVKAVNEKGEVIPPSEYTTKFTSEKASLVSADGSNAVFEIISVGAVTIRAEINYHGMIKLADVTVVADPGLISLNDGWNFERIGNAEGFVCELGDEKYSMLTNSGDIFGKADDFVFMYKEFDTASLSDGASITCTLDPYLYSSNTSSAIGVMIRNGLNPDSAHAQIRIQPDGTVRGIWRERDGDGSNYLAGNSVGLPYKVGISKSGNKCTLMYGTDDNMKEVGHVEVSFGEKLYMGVALMANAGGNAAEGCFSNVVINN